MKKKKIDNGWRRQWMFSEYDYFVAKAFLEFCKFYWSQEHFVLEKHKVLGYYEVFHLWRKPDIPPLPTKIHQYYF